MALALWPDTTYAPPPLGNADEAAVWLLGRHPALAAALDKVLGVVKYEDGQPWVDLDRLAAELAAYDQAVREFYAGRESLLYGPEHPVPVPVELARRAVAELTGGERAMLRLLAVFSAGNVPARVEDVEAVNCQQFVRDWRVAVQAAREGER